jgi:hypothetical protein
VVENKEYVEISNKTLQYRNRYQHNRKTLVSGMVTIVTLALVLFFWL